MNYAKYITSLLTIVVPSHSREKSVVRCVDSLISCLQGIYDVKILVILDGANYSPLVVQNLAKHRAVEIMAIERQGPAAARNYGVAATASQYVCFIDDDCVAPDGFAQNWLRILKNLPEDVVAIGGSVRCLARKRRTLACRYLNAIRHLDGPLTSNSEIVNMASANLCVRRKALVSCGGFDTRFQWAGGEDQHLVCRLRKVGQIQFTDQICVLHDNNISLAKFCRKFFNYGKGVALNDRLLRNSVPLDTAYKPLSARWYQCGQIVREYRSRVQLTLSRINPCDMTRLDKLLAFIQEISFQLGYFVQTRRERSDG